MKKVLILDDGSAFMVGIRLLIKDSCDNISICNDSDISNILNILTSEYCHVLIANFDAISLEEQISIFRCNSLNPNPAVLAFSEQRPSENFAMVNNYSALVVVRKTVKQGFFLRTFNNLLNESDTQLYNFSRHSSCDGMSSTTAHVPNLPPNSKTKLESFGLTPRQHEVLEFVSQGYTNKEIARILNITESTTKVHVTAILRSMNVKNRIRAVQTYQTLDKAHY